MLDRALGLGGRSKRASVSGSGHAATISASAFSPSALGRCSQMSLGHERHGRMQQAKRVVQHEHEIALRLQASNRIGASARRLAFENSMYQSQNSFQKNVVQLAAPPRRTGMRKSPP